MNIGTEDGNTHKVILEGEKRIPLYGLSVGQEFEGNIIEVAELDGYTLKITGGSDDSGTPLRQDLKGSGFRRLLLKGGVGFTPKRSGERRKKRVRGAEIQDDVAQLNLKVIKAGSSPLSS
jgi:small subunit ribosomal protein S6e